MVFENDQILTRNQQMLAIIRTIGSIARTLQPVLITGETGVGKELVAKAIHRESGVKGELVIVNVAGLDDQMLSDALFGHIKGAFTGADRNRKGLVEKAADGTLFLDEIGDLSPISQIKLLRLVQNQEYFPLGSDRLQRSRARIVTATNQDLWKFQKEGRFRMDLNFRLRAHHIHVPPLSERKDDIPLLADHFIAQAAKTLTISKLSVSEKLYSLLGDYAYPGNVRELQQMIFNALSMNDNGKITECLEDYIARNARFLTAVPCEKNNETQPVIFTGSLPTLEEVSMLLVREAMKRSGGNLTRAAGLIGISRQALSKRLQKIRN